MLPKELRERLGLAPGTNVEVHEEDGKAVVEPEEDPERVIERMERLLEEIPEVLDPTPSAELDPPSRDHVDTIGEAAKRAEESNDSDE